MVPVLVFASKDLPLTFVYAIFCKLEKSPFHPLICSRSYEEGVDDDDDDYYYYYKT